MRSSFFILFFFYTLFKHLLFCATLEKKNFLQVQIGAFARVGQMKRSYRRHWTTRVELERTATQYTQTGFVTTQTLSWLTAITLSTAISKRRARLRALVISLALLLSPLLTLVSSPPLLLLLLLLLGVKGYFGLFEIIS